MGRALAIPLTPAARRRATRRKWLVRAVAGSVVVAALAYAALPYWLPAEWVRQQLETDLTRDMGVPVRVGGFTAGWLSGTQIRDLIIAGNNADASAPALHIKRIRCDLAPLTFLTGGKLREIRIIEPHIRVRLDSDRKLDLSGLLGKRGRRLPSLNYSVEDLTCHVASGSIEQTFRIDGLTLQLDPPSGLLHLASATEVARPSPEPDEPREGRLEFDANVRLPRLNKREPLSGDIRVEWTDLALNDLPVPIIWHLPVEQVDGTSSGRIDLTTHPDLGVDYTLSIALAGVEVMRPELPQPARLPDADLLTRGRWQPTEALLVMHELLFDTPGVRIEAGDPELPAIRLDEGATEPITVHVRGHVKDWNRLRGEVPELDQAALRVGLVIAGQAEFAGRFSRTLEADSLELAIDATESHCVSRREVPLVDLPRGIAKSFDIKFDASRHSPRVVMPHMSLRVGQSVLQGAGEIDMPTQEASMHFSQLLKSLQGELRFETPDTSDLSRLLPGVAENLAIEETDGPLKCTFRVDPLGYASRFRADVELPAQTRVSAKPYLDKHRGKPLRLEADARLPLVHESRLDLAKLTLEAGDGRAEFRSRQGGLSYRFDDTWRPDLAWPTNGEADWRFALRVRRIEEITRLSPWLGKRLERSGVRTFAGDFEFDGQVAATFRPRDLRLETHLHVPAETLELRIRRLLHKKSDQPLALDLSHAFHRTDTLHEHTLDASLSRPSGRVAVHCRSLKNNRAQGDKAGDASTLAVRLRVDLDDVADWLTLSPNLRRRISPEVLAGAVHLSLEHRRSGRRHSGRARADMADLAFRSADPKGINKPRGIPAGLEVAWTGEPADDDTNATTWRLTEGGAELAGLSVDALRAECSIDSADRAGAAGSGLFAAKSRPFDNLHLTAGGGLRIDDDIGTLHPGLSDLIERANLGGQLRWNCRLRIDREHAGLEGTINADDLTCIVHTGHPTIGHFVKSAGVPVRLSWSLRRPRDGAALGRNLTIDDATLDWAGNRISAAGSLFLDDGGFEASPFSVVTRIELDRPAALLDVLSGRPIDVLAGALDAELTLSREKDNVRLAQAEAVLRDLRVGPAAAPIRLDGTITATNEAVTVPQLDWSWGQSSGAISGEFERRDGNNRLEMAITGQQVLAFNLLRNIQAFAGEWRVSDANTDSSADDSADKRNAMLAILNRTSASVVANVGTLITPLPLNITATADGTWQELTLAGGQANLQFGCVVDGGLVRGQVVVDLSADEPKYHLAYTADRIQPGSIVDAYLRRTFPGMTADGPLTLIDESIAKVFPTAGEPNYETGKGELIIDGGVVTGRAAPLWMTRVFPGLNLSSFDFSRMHSWFDKTDDGRVRHQMIYQGQYYHVYMIGWSDQTGRFEYEVGLDFLAGLESEYWANTGQGRVPLFTKTGRIDKRGRLHDESVNFVAFDRVINTLVVSNNPLVTAYHAVRKRVTGGP